MVWWISFFGLAYIYLLVANLCFLVIWFLSSRPKLILISLASLLIGWPFVERNVQFFSKQIPDEAYDKSVKVLTFNVQGFFQMESMNPDGTKGYALDFFRDSEADIICMQEFMTSQWEKGLSEENIRKQLNKTPFYQIELSIGTSGIATFSKFPIINKKLIFSDNTTNACMFCDLLIGKDTVRVFNVHLKSIGFHDDERYLLNNVVKTEYSDSDVYTMKNIVRQMIKSSISRVDQVDIVSSYIAQSPYPVIVCGDFNDPPSSYTYQRVRNHLKDAFVEAGSGRSTTYDIGQLSSQRIDYILYSDNYKAFDYESPREQISDHFPVMCRLVKQ